jgi:hypothetical protein
MIDPAKAIRIGTMVNATGGTTTERIAELRDLGFESFEPFFWQTTNGQDLAELGKHCVEAIGERDITISTLGMFGNPLTDSLPAYKRVWSELAKRAADKGVAGYAGSIDIEGWHDPVYRDALEMTGQVHALNHLKQCRGGDHVTLAANDEGGDPSLRSAS